MSIFSSSNGTLTLTKISLLMRPMWFTTVSAIRLTSLQYTIMMIPPSLSSLSSLLTTAISSSNLRIPRFDFTQKEPPPRGNLLGGFLIPSPASGLPPLCAVPQAALYPLPHPNRKPLCTVLTSLRPIPHPPVKAHKKAARKTGRLAFLRNYLSCTRSRIESVTESCTLCAE